MANISAQIPLLPVIFMMEATFLGSHFRISIKLHYKLDQSGKFQFKQCLPMGQSDKWTTLFFMADKTTMAFLTRDNDNRDFAYHVTMTIFFLD